MLNISFSSLSLQCQSKQRHLSFGTIFTLSLIVLLSLFVCFASFIPRLHEYSAITTLKKIFSLNKNHSTYSFLNGIRALSLFWIILGHSFIFQLTISDNILHVLDILRNSYTMQLLLGAIFGVDTFFFISGFLAVFAFLNTFKIQGKSFKQTKKRNKISFYLRWLSISTFICLLFSSLLSFNSNISICITC